MTHFSPTCFLSSTSGEQPGPSRASHSFLPFLSFHIHSSDSDLPSRCFPADTKDTRPSKLILFSSTTTSETSSQSEGKKRIHLNDQPLPITSISTLISVDRRVQIGPTCRIRDCRAKKMKEKDRGPISFSDIDASPSIPRRSFGTGITQECRWSIVHGRRGEGKRILKKKNSQTLTQTEPWSSTCGYQLPQTQAIAVRRTPELDKFIHHNWFFNVQRRI